jgi:hypothetical protein
MVTFSCYPPTGPAAPSRPTLAKRGTGRLSFVELSARRIVAIVTFIIVIAKGRTVVGTTVGSTVRGTVDSTVGGTVGGIVVRGTVTTGATVMV